MKNFLVLIWLFAVCFVRANDMFPDRTPVPEWFHQFEPADINTLGKQYRLTDYGAINDSTILQTDKIQSVIDKAHENGGGVIIVPSGTFLTGSLFFKQGTHLHLEKNARLKGSDDISHFKLLTTRMEGQTLKYFAALVNADGLNGFTVSGNGTIDGNGLRYWKAFWLRREFNPQCTNMDEMRPRLLYISNCKNVQVSGLQLINSPFWTSHYYKCENLKILGIRILAGTNNGYGISAPSSDGIDLDVCRNVLIKNCYISVNDDGVCLKGGKGPLADKDPNNGENRNIIVEDNTFDNCPALTLGSESVHTYNVIMRRCSMKNIASVLLLKMRPDTPQKHEYVLVEDITGTAHGLLEISPWTQFFDLKGQPKPHSSAKNIIVRNCNIKCDRFINIKQSEQYTLSDFTLENLNITTSAEPNSTFDFIRNLRSKDITVNNRKLILHSQIVCNETTKPWTRWWWFGNAVTEKDITAALEACQKAGLGGVEITPIYGVKGEEQHFIDYLSPAWMEKLVYTLNEAKRLGLGVDMANASGWPFGGPWVTEDNASKYFTSKTFAVEGGTVFNDTLQLIQKPIIRTQGSPDAFDQIRREKELPLIALTANKKGKDGGFPQTLDLKDKVQNGILHWNAPEGEWLVCALFEGGHGKMVERAGPGGEGLAIDHFSHKALENYLKKFDTAFKGYDLSYLRCFFNDSYEVDDASGEANFTPGLFAEFEKLNHYRLEDYLPALLGLDRDELNCRVLYDYQTTIGKRLEDFTGQWREWAKKQGKSIRNQGHGSPANVLDLYAASDIPEIEGNDVVNLKAAASAAHVTGKKLVSSETATWLNEHFESTLGDVKNAVDKMFLAGVNHIFYHGTAYSPQGAPFPGWLFYAAVHFTPQNTFWDDFGTLNNYVANTQKYLQAGKPSNDILVYFPVADLWSTPTRNGDLLQHFHSDRLFDVTSLKACGDYLTRQGYSWDAISDRQLQDLQNDNMRGYKLIFVPQTTLMDVRTFEKLVRIAQGGTKVIFYKNMPEDVPGLTDLEQNRKKLTGLLKIATTCPDMHVLNDLSDFAKCSGIACESFYTDSLQSIRRQKDDEGFYYFIRNDRETAFENFVSLNADYVSAVLYNPMTGKSGYAMMRKTGEKNEILLQLKPQESLIIETFNDRHEGANYPCCEVSGETVTLSGDWTVDFVKGGPTLPPQKTISQLESWTNWGSDYAAFSGTAEYQTLIPAMNGKCDVWRLDLGAVNASAAVYLNGKHIQTLINSPFSVDIPAALLKGDDTLAVRVSNLMANRIADMDKKDIPYRIFYNTNFNARRKENIGEDGKFSAKKWKPGQSGISGTVTLTPMRIMKVQTYSQVQPDRQQVLNTMVRVNNYFMKKYADYTQPSNVTKIRPSNIWTRGVYYEGLMALYRIYPQEEYYRYMFDWAEFHRWGMRNGNTTRNADDHCCGQTYIDLYKMSPNPEQIRNIKASMDMLVNSPQADDWSWIDAVQMGMPVLAKLGEITGDARYYEKMYQMYAFTRNNHGANGLYNPEEGLWWRDATFLPPYKEPNGKNCYWSRGNGWVYVALARVLEIIPANEPHRKEYEADFIAMSESLIKCQRNDGFWNVSLHDSNHFSGKETTGTSLFVYGMAWGINNKLLSREMYLHALLKAWNGLEKEAVHSDGFLGWVQSTGKEPKDGQPVTYDKIPDFEDYGVGCFLLAGSEIYKLK